MSTDPSRRNAAPLDEVVSDAERLVTRAATLPCVRSTDLLGKDREIMIEHSGMYYRLTVTRANKLILTK